MELKKLYITTMASHPWGGSEELWVQMALDDLNSGNKVHCSIFNWGSMPEKIKALQNAGAIIHQRNRFQYSEIIKKPWGKLVEKSIALKQLQKAVQKAKPDNVVISMGGFCDLEVDVYRYYLLELKSSYELIVHANPENYYLRPSKIEEVVEVCKKSKTIHFVSSRLKEIAIRQTGYYFPNSALIKNPVNMLETGILPWPCNKTAQLACVGRLEASVKGHPILFQTLADRKWKERNWHLNIFGTGPDESYYRHLINAFELKDNVTFHGFTNDIRKDIWAENHILVMPSYYEGMPIALVEAMLSGRTAVVTDVGGNSEIIENNKSGFIAEGVHLTSFSNAMERAWERKNEWEAIGIKAHTKINTFFYH